MFHVFSCLGRSGEYIHLTVLAVVQASADASATPKLVDRDTAPPGAIPGSAQLLEYRGFAFVLCQSDVSV